LKSSSKKPELEFHFLTLFPEVFAPVLGSSLLGKAQSRGLVRYVTHQIRDFSEDKHRTVDGTPYGGGEGMLLRADVLHRAWKKALPRKSARARTLLLSPQGRPLTQERAKAWVRDYRKLVLVCGHYEGVDERFIEKCVDEEVSIGDYVLTGGELPALVLADVLTRLLPGVVGNSRSLSEDSLEGGLLKYPQYTRPAVFEGLLVPEVLLSGNHGKIAEWRQSERVRRTREKRPDLLKK
jgi:tRNA (guanine37-N1)-methyltransferase